MEESARIKTSKYLSYVLRHGAQKEGVSMAPDGSVALEDLLRRPQLKGLSSKEIKHIVETCPKQRFVLLPGTGPTGLRIRAAQGHTIKVADESQLLTAITDASKFPVVVHGTYAKLVPVIKREGLSRMRRRHIHFATGLPGDQEVKSGMRKSCTAFVYIDLAKCLRDGIPFFVSSNNVVLSPGLGSTGILPPQYFTNVVIKDKKSSQ